MTTTDVLDLVHRWAAAEQRNDPGLLDGVLADGFVGVGPAGFVLTRQQWLDRFGHGLHNDTFTVEDAEVHEHGDATAVVIGVDAQQTTYGGHDSSGRYRVTVVAARPAETWLVAGVHIGPLREQPAGA